MINFKVMNSLRILDKKPRLAEPGEICSPCGTHLGDCWSFVSYVLKYRIKTISVNDHTERKIREIIPLLDSNHRPTIVSNRKGARSVWSFGHKYVRTKIHWTDRYYGKVCYQFDGRSSTQAKNLPRQKEFTLIEAIEKLGSIPVKLGSELSLLECVQEAATSDLFVGVESGMSHLCHSVGVPTIIIPSSLGEDFIKKYHNNNEYEKINSSIIYARMREIVINKRKLALGGKIENKSVMPLGYHLSLLRQEPCHKPRYRVVANS